MLLQVSMIVLGILLIIVYAQMLKALPGLVATSDVARALAGLYTMGVIFLTVGVSLALLGCKLGATNTHMVYFGIVLGVVLTALAGVLVSKTDGTAKKWAIAVLVVGVLFMVGCGALLAGKHTGVYDLSYCSL